MKTYIDIPYSDNSNVFDVHWINGTEDFIWTNTNGIYKTNSLTHETTIIKTDCGQAENYGRFSIDNQNQKLYVQKTTYTEKDDETLKIRSDIYSINFDGGGEIRINLP
ncbi:MAG: hypothetical protein M0D57_10490 [Sphingobacteriales bacterium JAD_PAG50586_3]|nr:MAG: hypothetical protein M0D57_10490 [Sphingobacteriales bacterium JAD_PAG50586_3]